MSAPTTWRPNRSWKYYAMSGAGYLLFLSAFSPMVMSASLRGRVITTIVVILGWAGYSYLWYELLMPRLIVAMERRAKKKREKSQTG